jgi:hypothetical protein
MKLAVVGGGSTYTPELVDGVARLADDVKVTELVLVDEAPLATLRIVDIPPVAGAALLGLDHIGAPPGARARLRDAYLAQPAPP